MIQKNYLQLYTDWKMNKVFDFLSPSAAKEGLFLFLLGQLLEGILWWLCTKEEKEIWQVELFWIFSNSF